MTRTLLALLLTLLTPGVALPCTCSWAGPFTRVALSADLIVLAEVRAHDRHGMDVTVLEVLRGRERRRVIRVWGDTGGLCRPPVSEFPVGTRWILAVKRSGQATEPGYTLSFCGEHWLQARGDQAVGRITLTQYGPDMQAAPLTEVLAWVRSGGAGPVPRTLP